MKILIVDDNLKFCENVAKYLSIKMGYDCDIATSEVELFLAVRNSHYDLITLDIELADNNGIQLLPRLKVAYSGPVILISCLTDAENRIEGLKSGADDYMTKPIVLEELSIRIQKLINRTDESNVLKIGDYVLDERNLIVYYQNKRLNLGDTSIYVLSILLKNKGISISRDRISRHVWGTELYESRTVDMAIARIRKETDDRRIKTVRGEGYIYEEE